ncbi:MAG TPA: precorrin-2 C(20)-methyltransferase [Holophaga sp.]|nr:precorrin-2 C(20)-methyltransferase [Holophaga sp.]
MNPEPGHFYAVGVGPGAPDLLTLRAARLIEGCDALIAPRSERSETSLALGIVRAHLREPELLEFTYPMTRDTTRTRASWGSVADWSVTRLEAGKSVVQITLGDPLIYSTSSYLLEALRDRIPGDRIHVVPGISALQATASAFQEDLTLQEDRLTLLPATDLGAVAEALDRSETVVLYKVADRLDSLIDLLEAKGLLENARLAFAVEQDRQQLIRDLRQARGTKLGYMSVVMVRTGRKAWREA